jgi:voltage-gated potassium channel
MEIIASVWFSFDYGLRLYSTPLKRLKFILKPLNVVDLISNLPFYIDLIVTAAFYPNKMNNDFKSVLRIVQILRIVRVTKTSIGLKALGYTVKRSQKDLLLLMCLIFSSVLILTGVTYLAEKDTPDSKFDSIPACIYWGIIIIFIFLIFSIY